MSRDSRVIPFFQLGLNVLPGEPCPLHVFEPRYRRLLRHCLTGGVAGEVDPSSERQLPFGISFAHRSVIEPIGCLVEIANMLKVFDDGRSLVVTTGVQRYRLLERIEDEEFPKARVVLLDDVTEGVSPELQDEIVDLYARVAHMEGLAEQEIPNTSELLSYHVASQLQLEQAERQMLLNQISERKRLETLQEILGFRLKVLRHAVVGAEHGQIQ